MRNEDGVFCDIVLQGNTRRCAKPATYLHSCRIENSEFAFCRAHEREWKELTSGHADWQIRCPRCISIMNLPFHSALTARQLPPPITGPLAEAFRAAMHLEGVPHPTQVKVLQRMAQNTDLYIQGILRTTAIQDDYEDSRH